MTSHANAMLLDACKIHVEDIPFGIDEVPDDEFIRLAEVVSEEIVKNISINKDGR